MPTATPSTSDAKIETQIFWIRFHKEIVAALILLVLGAIGYAGYRFYSQHQEDAAAALLATAKKPEDYGQVITKYPNTAAGASACVFLAEQQRSEKNFIGANISLKEFITKHPQHELVGAARLAMAANLESLGKPDDALLMYQSAAASNPRNYTAPIALMSQVRLLKEKKQTDEARRICEKVIAEHSDSYWANDAFRQLQELKPATPQIPPGLGGLVPGAPGPPPLIARPPSPPVVTPPPASPK